MGAEFFALLIPVAAAVVGMIFYKNKLTWWELLFPLVVCIGVIVGCKSCVKTALVTDDEYWGSMIVRARYYEYWSTWVKQTCTRTYECNCTTDNNGHETCQTCTETYDCSYCDTNEPEWIAYDDAGNSWSISEQYYAFLQRKWGADRKFVDMHRSINTHWSCGKDGNAYDIVWGGEQASSEAAVTIHSYTNRVQAAHSAFKLPEISRKQAKKEGLYDYPEKYDYYKQRVLLGIDSIYTQSEVRTMETLFQYYNGHYGHINKVKLFVLFFYDKPLQIAYDQEAYWDGGNQNELVVCISLNKTTREIQWVKPFSWTNNKRVLIDVRENIAELKTFNSFVRLYDAIGNAVGNFDMHRDFDTDFNYLTIELPTWSYWLIWTLTLFVTAGMFIWGIGNEYETGESDEGKFDIVDWFNKVLKLR